MNKPPVEFAPLELVEAGVPTPEKRADIPAIWEDYHAKALCLKTTAETLTVTDVNDKAGMALARATRLSIRDLRLGFTKTHEELKSQALKTCQELDAEKRKLIAICEPLEARLKEQEEFAERKETERKSALVFTRLGELSRFGADLKGYNLGEMADSDYRALYDDLHFSHEAKLAEAARVAAEKAAQDELDRQERARLKVENDRLVREAQEREVEAQKERDAAAAKLASERANAAAAAELERKRVAADKAIADAAAKVERDKAAALAKQEREAREKIEEELEEARSAKALADFAARAAAETARKAPDREKFAALAARLQAVELPTVTTTEANKLLGEIQTMITALVVAIQKGASSL